MSRPRRARGESSAPRAARRVLITGASRGLGLEFTRGYLERGDRVFAACRRPAAARALAALARAHPDRLTVGPLDVTGAASIRAAHAIVRQRGPQRATRRAPLRSSRSAYLGPTRWARSW